MSLDVLTLEQVRRELFGRQGLTQRFASPSAALEGIGVIQTQYVASLSTAIAARCEGYTPGWDARALADGGEAIRCWSLRATVHAHSKQAHARILGAIGAAHLAKSQKWREEIGMPVDLDDQIHAALGEGPLTRKQLHDRVPILKEMPWTGWGTDCRNLSHQGKLAMVGMGADQRFGAYPGTLQPVSWGELFLDYLQCHAPASVDDFAYWTGGSKPLIRKGIALLGDRLRPVQIEGRTGTYYMPDEPSTERLPLEGVRLLAKFDPVTMAHFDKTAYLPLPLRTRVFRIAAQVEATVLDQSGMVATWRMARGAKALSFTFEPFGKVTKREMKVWQREAERLAMLLGYTRADFP